MHLLQIFNELGKSTSYDDLWGHARDSGFKGTKQSMVNLVKGETVNPTPETIEAVRVAFVKATKEWKPSLTKEVDAFFDKNYKEVTTDDDA